jgi:transcriptional regulator GlxA family with amidase domain
MPNWTMPPRDPVEIDVLVFDRFSNLCLANAVEPLRAANTFAGRAAYRWRLLTRDGAPVASSSGLRLMPEAEARPRACDYLFVLASYGAETQDGPATRRALRAMAAKARVVAGLDTGPWLMAAAGLLDGRRATVHWDALDGFAERFPGIEALRERVVTDGNRLTCAGAMSAYEMAAGLVRAHLGEAAALEIDGLFMAGEARAAPGPGQGLTGRALALMRAHLETPLAVEEIARRLGCQRRTLDRRFVAETGAPAGRVYRHLRLSAARQMAETGRLPVSEIALRTGYESPAALARAFRARYGESIRALRQG